MAKERIPREYRDQKPPRWKSGAAPSVYLSAMAKEIMTLAQALKRKNRLAQMVADARQRASQHNSTLEGNAPAFNVHELMAQARQNQERLVRLKAAISRANEPIQEEIYRMAELKGEASWLRGLTINEGVTMAPYAQTTQTYTAQLGSREQAELIAAVEDEIDAVQERLDRHNAITEIEIDLE